MSFPDTPSHDERPDLPQLDPSLAVDQPDVPLCPLSPSQSSSRSKKSRREKPRLELAPDQPLTTQGKPRARVYVACLQCRTRKIRCDGAKPTCHNCTRRGKPTDPCVYDAAPKRRGPDKTPGARQRMAREARQESDTDTVASRRRRRKRHDTASPPPHSQFRPLPTSPHPLAPLRQPSLALDPQLADMPPFRSTLAASPSPLRSDSSLTGSGLVMSDSLPVFSDGTLYHMTSSQGLHNILSFTSHLDYHPPVSPRVDATMTHAFISPYEDHDTDSSEDSPNITSEPSLDFARQTWWDSLLSMYYSSVPSLSAPISKRQQAANHITSDLRFLFRSSNYWFSFINVPHFLSIYFDPERRVRMQPSFLLAALAIATFFQSSEAGFGKEGRRKAMRLRDVAQGALEASLNARWIDEELAQAAWLLALFEVCAHPNHTSERSSCGLVILDTIIRTLSLTLVDMEDPASSRFSQRSVPTVMSTSQSWATNSLLNAGVDNTHFSYSRQGCSCASRSLGQRSAAAHDYTPLWLSSPAWDNSWSEAEIRKETCRRLCWSTLVLMAGHTSYVMSANRTPSELFILEPANFAILFPGEVIRSPDGHSGKDTIWSLNYRTMLLWHSCLRMRHDPSVSEAEMARFGLDAWLEADVLEKALNSHKCGLERTFLFQGREYLFNVRLIVTHEFQRYIPVGTADVDHLFHKKAKEWLTHQANVAQRVVQSMGAVTGNGSSTLVHRPFFAFWFMSQINRALSLWECDNSLTLALDVGTALFGPIDYLSALWPCSDITPSLVRDDQPSTSMLKRPPSPSFEGAHEEITRKRFKEDSPQDTAQMPIASTSKYDALVDDLAQELQCGCCAGLVYRPVVVSPCQHFFCGSCCVLWIKNGGTNCPACRGISSFVTPSRPLQTIVDVVLRAEPSRMRTERERMQADEIYKAGSSMRIPTPREASPEPNLNQNSDYARPCPHCGPDNPYGWRCPHPIVDFAVDPEQAWHLDDGAPPGHAYCGNCEMLLALGAPVTTKCDFCQVSFCGINVQGRCTALPLVAQHPHNMSDMGDLIQSSEVYECFENNTVEVEIMLDYLTKRQITPRQIYRDIVQHLQSQSNGFRPLFELDLFVDMHSVAAGIDDNPNAPRTRICRPCATEVLLWGLREWWIQERQKGHLDAAIANRPDCEQGGSCTRQKDLAHAKEYNHLVSTSATRSVQVPGSPAGLPGREMVPERDNEPDPVTQRRNAGEVVQASSGVESDTSPDVGSRVDDRSNVPLS
ncbi:hypothetical protein J3R82DRAFT_9614 [Butyriboletus roseoflavus]|nr:hypothetical protein J3R82DRAFT_9614 [Butyriboletus roseoflavus]